MQRATRVGDGHLNRNCISAGDFLLATNIMLSGNNFAKVALLFEFMNLGMVSWVQFERIQALYAIPTIMGYWERLRTATVQQLQGTYLLDTGGDRRVSMSSYLLFIGSVQGIDGLVFIVACRWR